MRPTIERREAVRLLLEDRGDLLVVSGLGSPTWDAAAAGDHPGNFYLWGAMGGAAMIGLGLAQAKPELPVLVLTGDGEQLMGMGSLATIGAAAPSNLTIVVLDNQHYAETGMQPSHTGMGTRLEAVALASGLAWSERINDPQSISALRRRVHALDGAGLAVLEIDTAETPRIMPSRDGVAIKNRFRASLGKNKVPNLA